MQIVDQKTVSEALEGYAGDEIEVLLLRNGKRYENEFCYAERTSFWNFGKLAKGSY